jgi:hypothetical protein
MAKRKKSKGLMKPLMSGVKGATRKGKKVVPSKGTAAKAARSVPTEGRQPADRGRPGGMFKRGGMPRPGAMRRMGALERRLEDKEM